MEARRQIPPLNDLRNAPQLAGYRGLLETPFGIKLLDDVIGDTRRSLAAGTAVVPRSELISQIANEAANRFREVLRPSLRRVINASGVVLHTNLGRAPLPASAIDHLRDVSTGYSNLEFDVTSGSRGKRDSHIERLI